MARYKVIDLETQTATYLKRKASRWHKLNYIVATGWKNQGDKQCSYEYFDKPGKYAVHIEDDVNLLIGFNLKFDLMWLWDDPGLKAFFKRGGRIWDCQYVEYLLHGQDPRYHMVALTDTAPRYGGTAKIDEVKILWDQGVNTSEIPKDLLIDYLVGTHEENRNGGDIGNTEKIFLGQLKRARELGMLTAIWSRMDGLCATTEMEFNGLQIDIEEARTQLKELKCKRTEAWNELQTFVPELPEGLVFNWGSRTHKSCLIYGGTVKYQVKDTYIDEKTGELARYKATEKWPLINGEPVNPTLCHVRDNGLYQHCESFALQDVFGSGKNVGSGKFKNVDVEGELKTKYVEKYFRFPGYVRPQAAWAGKQTDAAGQPLYSTSSETIELLKSFDVPFCEVLTSYEALEKEIGTYFVTFDPKTGVATGMLVCVDPETHQIHHSLNHTATVTSRLSANNPNMQNVPRGDKSRVKALFVSRFPDGRMIEADYSQLEVVVQGVLSGDPQLCEDLRNKIDFHCKRIAIQAKYGKTYDEVVELCSNEDGPDYKKWKKIRTATKVFSFQRAYGAGAPLIALSTGMTVEEVQELIDAEEATYPGVSAYNKIVADAVIESSEPFFDPEREKMCRRGTYQAPTGCLYTFRSYPADRDWQIERGILDSFSPTEQKNYPVQGTGGEIVQGICGRLWRHFVSNDNYGGRALLVNTVHDCVWADSHPDVTAEVCADMKRIMEAVDDWFLQFNIKITVPFPVQVEVGPNMLDLKHAA